MLTHAERIAVPRPTALLRSELHDRQPRPTASLAIAAVAALVWALSACAANVRQLQPTTPFAADGRALFLDGAAYYYVDRGRGEAVVLIHGFGGTSYSYRGVIEPLANERRTLTPDLMGFGLSDRPDIDYDMELYVRQILHLLDQNGIMRAHLVGNSMGGRVAVALALSHPERVLSLALLNAAVYRDKVDRPALFRLGSLPCVGTVLSGFVTRGRVRSILEEVHHVDGRIRPGDVEAYYGPLRRRHAFRAPLRLLQNPGDTISPRLAELRTPTLVLWGRHDPWIALEQGERLAREIKGAELVVIDDAGHIPQEETPARVARELKAFWKRSAR